jgi:hypothetical protein
MSGPATTRTAGSMASGWKERSGDARYALSEEVAENLERVESALATRATKRDQHLLGLRAEPRAIATGDLSIHDGWPERLFGTPGGRVDRRVVQETEERRPLAVQMPDEPPYAWHRRALVEHGGQPRLQVAAGHCEAVDRDRASGVAVPDLQCLLQHGLHLIGERRVGMIDLQLATATEEMGQTGLMRRLHKLPIGSPAIADEHARKVGAEERRRLVEATTRFNRVDGGGGRCPHPQPLQLCAHTPAGFVGRDHRTLLNRLDQRGIGRRGLPRGAMEGVDHPAGGDRQPEVLLKDRGHLADGHAELLMQDGGSGCGARANLSGGRAERIGCLQGMSAWDAAPTPLTLSNVDVKRAHDRSHGRQVFLVLRREARFDHRARTARTDGRDRRFVRFIDMQGNGSLRRPPICRTWLAPGPSWVHGGPILGKRRRLPTPGPPRRFEFLAQSFVFAPQPLDLSPQRLALSFGAFGTFAQRVDLGAGGIGGPLFRHADVMPEPRKKYKYGMLDRSFSELNRAARTR